jgi:hypothetical protein
VKVTVNIAGLDATTLVAPLRQALIDALRLRLATSHPAPSGGRNMPNALPEASWPAPR